VNLTVDISRDLDLLSRLKGRLGMVGVQAELRDHLMSLVVFPPAPALPVCVFVGGNGNFYTWDGGRSRQSVTEVMKAANELAVFAVRHLRQQPHDVGSSER
jgi:hypothetical protein